MSFNIRPGDALLLVDVQNDFCPGGSLAVHDADDILPTANELVAAARRAGAPIVASRDWHPPGHASFRDRGGPWPPHCVRDTPGAAFRAGLDLPEAVIVVEKGTDPDRDAYSAFDGTNLDVTLRGLGIKRIWIAGLATDYCVKATVLDAIAHGFDVILVRSGIRAVDVRPGDGARAIDAMRDAGAEVVDEVPAA